MYMTALPHEPGYYCWVPDMECWVRFDQLVDALFLRVQYEPPCECRAVADPITECIT